MKTETRLLAGRRAALVGFVLSATLACGDGGERLPGASAAGASAAGASAVSPSGGAAIGTITPTGGAAASGGAQGGAEGSLTANPLPLPQGGGAPAGPLPTCVPQQAATAAACTGQYRNLFAEIGKSPVEIQAKLNAAWGQLFVGAESGRIFYPVGSDEAYVLDVNNDDVRSEGMSYGMMIAVQLDQREAFDKLWRWTSRFMRHASGPRAGYFAWQCTKDGQIRDANPASDGEAYFATALIFAAARWGNTGDIDYLAEGRAVLHTMLHKEDAGVVDSVTNMFNATTKMVVFTPFASAALFTDPSYHLPAFYEVWARVGLEDQPFWTQAALTSRGFFSDTMHPLTGLAPDYATFEGAPTGSGHIEFRFDAWRVVANLAVDHAWWSTHSAAPALVQRLLGFFRSEGFTTYANQYTIDGTSLSRDHSPGLVAMNAVGALALPAGAADDFVLALWDLPIPSGKYRYYDGVLYMMALLHASGQFRVYVP